MTAALKPQEGVKPETGEVVALPAVFDARLYLASISGASALEVQQQLSAAYDAACRALIGPNDVQKEGKREFKKKSAWRKLARHFGISVRCSLDDVRIERRETGFTAFAIATAGAPWGQAWADVGACGSDEATGRRVITEADAIATAMTRAANRAVSNLIAMGEDSAEEVGDRKPVDTEEGPPLESAPDPEPTSDTPWPGPGITHGKKLADWTQAQLLWLCEPGRKGPHIEIWQGLAKDVLKNRGRTTG